MTPRSWLKQLEAGRTFITNGPLLELTINNQPIGTTLEYDSAANQLLPLKARAVGRVDFKSLELIQDGKIVKQAKTQPVDGHYEAVLTGKFPMEKSCWFAVRTRDQRPAKNELDQPVFAHTSPIYVEVGGRKVFDRATAEVLLAELKAAPATIDKEGKFADDAERDRVLNVYREAIRTLEARIAESK